MAKQQSFEENLRALEQSVERLESGELSLEESLKLFEEGVKRAGLCQKMLQAVEQRVELLLKDREGRLVREDFDKE